MKKIQWNFNQNFKSFVQDNAFERLVCEMAVILFRLQFVELLVVIVYRAIADEKYLLSRPGLSSDVETIHQSSHDNCYNKGRKCNHSIWRNIWELLEMGKYKANELIRITYTFVGDNTVKIWLSD